MKCAISPDVPNNEGSFRPVAVHAPEGSLLNTSFPSAVGGRHLVGHFLPSVVMGALAEIVPDRVMAPGFDGLWDTHITGTNRKNGKHFSYTWFSSGGTGAMKNQDGLSATAYPSGIAGVPVEVIEFLAPIVIHKRELRMDSGGPGEFRGGLGQTMEIEVLSDEDFLFSGLYERTQKPAPGLSGGLEAPIGRLFTNNDTDLAPKVSSLVPSNTIITLEIPGGGGFGNPKKRRQELVLEDIKNGYVSARVARKIYGTRLDR